MKVISNARVGWLSALLRRLPAQSYQEQERVRTEVAQHSDSTWTYDLWLCEIISLYVDWKNKEKNKTVYKVAAQLKIQRLISKVRKEGFSHRCLGSRGLLAGLDCGRGGSDDAVGPGRGGGRARALARTSHTDIAQHPHHLQCRKLPFRPGHLLRSKPMQSR